MDLPTPQTFYRAHGDLDQNAVTQCEDTGRNCLDDFSPDNLLLRRQMRRAVTDTSAWLRFLQSILVAARTGLQLAAQCESSQRLAICWQTVSFCPDCGLVWWDSGAESRSIWAVNRCFLARKGVSENV